MSDKYPEYTNEALLEAELIRHRGDLAKKKAEIQKDIDEMYLIEQQPLFRISGLSEPDLQKYISLTAKLKFKIARL